MVALMCIVISIAFITAPGPIARSGQKLAKSIGLPAVFYQKTLVRISGVGFLVIGLFVLIAQGGPGDPAAA